MNQSLKALVIILAMLLPALLVNLGERPIYKIQEVRVAETAREMLESRDWLVPRYNGDIRLQKPPLPYWLTAASFSIAGVNEFAARLPSVLFGILSALVLWRWVGCSADSRTAINAAVIFVVSYIGLRYFRSAEADALLLFFISLSCMVGYDLIRKTSGRQAQFLFGLLLGLGFLSKGPAALAIPLISLSAFSLIARKMIGLNTSLKHLFSLSGVAALLVSAFGWYLWILWQLPEIGQAFFSRQIDDTFVSGTHARSLWWYLVKWPEFYAPWGILLIPAGWLYYKQRHLLSPMLIFAWTWLVVVLVLLTLTVNKQMQYALLFAPPMAIITAHYLACANGKLRLLNRALFVLFCIAILVGILVMAKRVGGASGLWLWLLIPAIPLLIYRLWPHDSGSRPVLLVAGLTSMAYLYGEMHLAKEPHKTAAQLLMIRASQHNPLYQLRTSLNDGALSFYGGRVIMPLAIEDIQKTLSDHSPIWLISEKSLDLPTVQSVIETEFDNLRLYRIERSP